MKRLLRVLVLAGGVFVLFQRTSPMLVWAQGCGWPNSNCPPVSSHDCIAAGDTAVTFPCSHDTVPRRPELLQLLQFGRYRSIR
jgi:hypothetical protein